MVYLFVLIAVATMDTGRVSSQTVGYHATAAECQHALIKAEDSVNKTYVKLKCYPTRAVE